MQPLSNNIVFTDLEFTDLSGAGEVLSIGLIKLTGEELYLEIETDAEPSDWVKQNVLKHMTGEKTTKEEARKQIRTFLGKEKPYLTAWVPHYDMVLTSQLFQGAFNTPFNWFPLDFASILFADGIDPEDYREENNRKFLKDLGIDASKYSTHHALDDAKLLREAWIAYFKQREVKTIQ